MALARRPREPVRFTGDPGIDEVLNDIEAHPHLFVLGSLMDKGVGRKKAWEVPQRLHDRFGLASFAFDQFAGLGHRRIERAFIEDNLHRYPTRMALVFQRALEHVAAGHGGEAARIWNDRPSSALLVQRLLAFDGMLAKDAALAGNTLVRDFKVPLADYSALDITPDIHVRRVFRRLGFVRNRATAEDLVRCARDLNGIYPGVFDQPAYQLGTTVCHGGAPACGRCDLKAVCPKYPDPPAPTASGGPARSNGDEPPGVSPMGRAINSELEWTPFPQGSAY